MLARLLNAGLAGYLLLASHIPMLTKGTSLCLQTTVLFDCYEQGSTHVLAVWPWHLAFHWLPLVPSGPASSSSLPLFFRFVVLVTVHLYDPLYIGSLTARPLPNISVNPACPSSTPGL
jgi:hypothetical protein